MWLSRAAHSAEQQLQQLQQQLQQLHMCAAFPVCTDRSGWDKGAGGKEQGTETFQPAFYKTGVQAQGA